MNKSESWKRIESSNLLMELLSIKKEEYIDSVGTVKSCDIIMSEDMTDLEKSACTLHFRRSAEHDKLIGHICKHYQLDVITVKSEDIDACLEKNGDIETLITINRLAIEIELLYYLIWALIGQHVDYLHPEKLTLREGWIVVESDESTDADCMNCISFMNCEKNRSRMN